MDTGDWAYQYDVENRLTRADGPGVTAEYLYDPLGQRTRKCVVNTEDIAEPCDDAASVITEFLSDGVEEIMDYDGRTGVASMRYLHGSGVDELLAWQDVASGVIQQLASDQLGSVVAQQVRWGAITETWRYSAYGEIMAGEETGQPFRYTGRRFDAETGIYYYRARYYSSTLGRFLQTDPIGYGDNMNMYAYVGNDPVNNTDPTGEYAAQAARAAWAVGAAAGRAAAPACARSPACVRAVLSTLSKVKNIINAVTEIVNQDEGEESDDPPSATEGDKGKEEGGKKPKEKAKDRRARQQAERHKEQGGEPEDGKGTPKGNQRQNRAFDDATRGLDEGQKGKLHEEISGQDLDYNQIKDLAQDILEEKK